MYAQQLRSHALPLFGRTALRDLRAQDVERLILGLQERGLSPSTVGTAVIAVKAVLADAVRDGLLARDPFAVVRTPSRTTRRESRYLTAEQSRALLDAAHGDRLEALIVVMLGVGLRRGEAIGLRWEDVDLEAGSLRVRRTVRRALGGGLVAGEPKTDRGRRTIRLPGFVVEALRQHRTRQLEERLVASYWEDASVVLASTTGSLLDPTRVARLVTALGAVAGIPGLHPHVFRHSTASLLLAAGVPLPMVSELLGHGSQLVTARIYSHVLPATRDEAAAALDRALGV